MRNPNTMNRIEPLSTSNVETLVIDTLPEYDLQDYDLFDEKDKKKYIVDIEKACRNSFEYRQMIKYLRENMNMNECSFYKNVNNIDTFKIKIHIHHEPFDLYNIALIVFNKRSFYRESLEVELVALEVMILHYSLLVGLIPLAETVHELVHNKYLFVPADKVLGHFNKFADMYHDYMEPEQIDALERIREATLVYNGDDLNVLDTKFVYVDLTGAYSLPPYEEIISMMNKRITEIRNNQNTLYKKYEDNNKLIEVVRFVK